MNAPPATGSMPDLDTLAHPREALQVVQTQTSRMGRKLILAGRVPLRGRERGRPHRVDRLRNETGQE